MVVSVLLFSPLPAESGCVCLDPNPARPLTNCVALGKLLPLAEPLTAHPKDRRGPCH